MGAASFVGRVGGIAVALGVGVAIAHGTAVASADTDSGNSGASRQTTRSASAAKPNRAATVRATPAAASAVTPNVARSTPNKAPVGAAAVSPKSAAVGELSLLPGPDPKATVTTQYGDLGKWMVNKNGEVADWVGIPYCKDSVCKTMQEPINTVFTVEAKSKFRAEATLNRTLRKAGFGPSCCSSVGYQAIVDDQNSQQMPRGGILGIGVLGPGFIERGLLGLIAGIGPAYRDASFLVANSHLRTFGGVSDGAGTYVFTGSVSKEFLDTSSGKPTHGYESFDEARDTLLAAMIGVGAKNGGTIDMDNEIPAVDPTYTTGDHDGLAQVIQLSAIRLGAGR